MTKVLLVTHWTGGDVIPFVKMGSMLKMQGFDVTLFAHCVYEDLAKSRALNFVALDTYDEYLEMTEEISALEDPINCYQQYMNFNKKHHGSERTFREYEIIREYCTDKDTVLLFRHRSSVSGLLAAEKNDVPVASIFLAPNYISHLHLHEELFGEEMKNEINLVRDKIQLSKITNWTDWMCSPRRKLALWPAWFSQKEDTLEGLRLIGFLNEKDKVNEALSEDVLKFVLNGEKPVLITGGTSKLINPLFYEVAVNTCLLAGKRAILVVAYDDFVPQYLPETVTRFRHVSITELLPYVSAVIHHGGIGTASEAVASGTPQMILPHMADRPDNAFRLKELGVAKCFSEAMWNPELMAEALREMETSAFLEKCLELAVQFHQENPSNVLFNTINEMCLHREAYLIPKSVSNCQQNLTEAAYESCTDTRGSAMQPHVRRLLLELMNRKSKDK